MALRLYGINNCDKVRAARNWLAEHGIPFTFTDLRSEDRAVLDTPLLDGWITSLGWERLVNRRSATWRQLAKTDRIALDDNRARELLLAHPTLLKRPVLTGFSTAGGPLLDPTVAAVVMVPIAPHSLAMRPIVLAGDQTIELAVRPTRGAASVSVDGQTAWVMQPDHTIEVVDAGAPVRLLRVLGSPFYDALRTKLGWRGRPDYRIDAAVE